MQLLSFDQLQSSSLSMFFPSLDISLLPLARPLATELFMPWRDGKGSPNRGVLAHGEERHRRSVGEGQLFVPLVFHYLLVAFLLIPYKKGIFIILADFSPCWPPCLTPPPSGVPALWSLKLLG